MSPPTVVGGLAVSPTVSASLIAAGAFRQPIWAKSFVLEAMNPIPDNYENDSYWT